MTKNTILNVAIKMCQLTRLFCVLLFLLLAGFFVHYQISPSSYEDVVFNTNINDSGVFFRTTTSDKMDVSGKVSEDADAFVFNELTMGSLYFNCIKYGIELLLVFLCVKEFQNVIESVKEIRTFQEGNISSFKRIGKYVLIIFVLMSYSSFTFQHGATSSFQISYVPLLLALLAFIMSEIFKEGYNLSEENKLTV